MATRPKAVIESRNGEKFSPITIAKNVLTDDGQNLHDILSDRKEDMMTPTIENSSSMSKVGQGDNVDFSDNVMNGAYEDVVLKGKSLVNVIQEPSSQDVVLPYEFEDGQYVTINDTKEGGALGVELKGQTLVNLVKKLNNDNVGYGNEAWKIQGSGQAAYSYDANKGITLTNTVQGSMVLDYMILSLFKPNTEYTLFVDVNWNGVGVAPHLTVISTREIRLNNGFNIIKFTSVPDLTVQYMCLRLGYAGTVTVGCEYTFNNIMVLEGDWTNVDIPYFEGMTSCKMPILHTVGKNLAKFTTDQKEVLLDSAVETTRTLTLDVDELLTIVNKNVGKRICLAYEVETSEETTYGHHSIDLRPEFEDGTTAWWATTPKRNGTVYRSHVIAQKVKQFLNKEVFFRSAKGTGRIYNVRIWISDTDTDTTYEPYKSSILSLPEEVVLRKVNGVEDTLNLNTGEYVQRTKEIVLNGSENWRLNKSLGDGSFYQFVVNIVQAKKVTQQLVVCDKLVSAPNESINNRIWIYEGTTMVIHSSCRNVDEMKTWLQQNPLTVQYELATPVVTKFNLPSTLKSWNTTTHIYSEIPENTLYPILSHSNPSYPVILKPSTKYSIVANSYSNGHTNSPINFNLGGATATTTVGNRVTTITTPSTLSNELLTMSGRGNKLNNVMVIEGDVVGDEPYFEGICDCKSPILLNCGENLFDKTKVKREKYQNYNVENGIFSISSNSNYKVTDYIRVKPNTSYTSRNLGNGAYYTFNKKPITDIFCRAGNFTVPSNAHYVVLNMPIGQDEDAVGLQEVPSSSLHESYKSNTTTFDQKDGKTIVLRSLPNGVCDTLNVETGEYVQRIKQIVLDGSENWSMDTNSGGATRFYNNMCTDIGIKHGTVSSNENLICDKFSHPTTNIWIDTNESIQVVLPNGLYFIFNNAQSVIQWKEYLQSNPITVQYQLATPIIKQVNVEGYPYAYENGHILLESGSQEQSLTPTIEYSIVANRGGQIRSNQRMVERHQKQLDRLQAMILTNLVNTQYEQTLTNLKYDLKNVREEVK